MATKLEDAELRWEQFVAHEAAKMPPGAPRSEAIARAATRWPSAHQEYLAAYNEQHNRVLTRR